MNENERSKFRVLVVEDEWVARNYLVELLEGSGQARVVGAIDNVRDAQQILETQANDLDVAFVDINLVGAGERAGLDLVHRFAGSSNAPAFVLATAFRQHALEAFAAGVVDYLVKPFTEERVHACLSRIARLRAEPRRMGSGRVVARKGKSLIFLESAEIWGFEAAQRLTYVHTRHGRYDIDLSLASVEQSVGRDLTRVHRNWLVHLPSVRELGKEGNEHFIFVGEGHDKELGIRVPVARERAAAIRELLLEEATGLRR